MAAIYVLLFITAAGFAVIVIATILVIIGVRQEERYNTFLRGDPPPTTCALLARWVLGAYVQMLPERRPELDEHRDDPGDEPPWYERPVGPKVH
jgi:hypothetical protein